VSVGRTRILVTVGDRQVPVYVSVVPRGTLAAAGPGGVYLFGLDGSGYRRVVAAQGARSPRWFPDGRHFVFTRGRFGEARVSDLDGATRPLVRWSEPEAQLWAHPSRDGEWVYFGGYSGPHPRGYPYRVRADGSGVQLVPGFIRDDRNQSHPSASPDGGRVAYFREEGDSRNVTLRILDLRTGELVLRDVPGHAPEWSHGDSIAYLDPDGGESGPIRLMSPDGGGRRQVGTGETYDFGFDWSPDDRWIVARDLEAQRLEIIHVATGQRIPLPYSAGLSDPAWKPSDNQSRIPVRRPIPSRPRAPER
jgi:Tol biopolymer transport system component